MAQEAAYLYTIKLFNIMKQTEAIKPGPKRQKEDGSDDKRQRVDPPNAPKHPGLKPHIHKPGEKR